MSLLLKCCHPPSTIYKFNCKLLNWIQWFTHLTNNLICITTTWHPAFFYYYFFRFLVIESSTSLWALLSICWSVGPLGHWLVHYGQSLFPIKTSMAYYYLFTSYLASQKVTLTLTHLLTHWLTDSLTHLLTHVTLKHWEPASIVLYTSSIPALQSLLTPSLSLSL